MHAAKAHQLKRDASQALRRARHAPVIIMKGNQPRAVMMRLDDDSVLGQPGVKLALATSLFKEGHLPLGRAARLAEMSLGEFMEYLSRRRIPVVRGTAREAKADLEALNVWLGSS